MMEAWLQHHLVRHDLHSVAYHGRLDGLNHLGKLKRAGRPPAGNAMTVSYNLC